MARSLADECVDLRVVAVLRRHGHDIVTVQALGLANGCTNDPDVLAAAIVEERAVLSPNRRHYIALHRLCPEHPGIVVSTATTVLDLASRLDAAIRAHVPLAGKCLKVYQLPAGIQIES